MKTAGTPDADLAQERRWAAGAHLSSIPGMLIGLGFVGPLLVLRTRAGDSRLVRQHAVGAMNFNVTVGLVAVLALTTTATFSRHSEADGPNWGLAAGFSALLLLTVYWFLFTVRAAMQARYGEPCKYPPSLPVVHEN